MVKTNSKEGPVKVFVLLVFFSHIPNTNIKQPYDFTEIQ